MQDFYDAIKHLAGGQVYAIVVTFDLPPAELSSGIKTKPTTKEVHKNPEQ